MNTSSPLKIRLAALRLNHLPPVVLTWIERDLEGMDDAALATALTPDYAARAVRLAVAEMARVGVPAVPAARQQWVATDGSGRVLETVTITRRAIRDLRRRPRKYLAEQLEFDFVASLKRAAARPLTEIREEGFFTSKGSADKCTR